MSRKTLMTALVSAALSIHAAALQAQSAQLDRGKYLVEGIAACGNCHAARNDKGEVIESRGLSGGMQFEAPVFKAFAPNITPDPETGIGKWSDAELGKAIREGVRPDGSIIGPPMPIEFLRAMSDEDLAAIIAYLRAQAPVRNAVTKSQYKIKLTSYGPALGKVKAPDQTDSVKYGAYLVSLGHCLECHTPQVKGQLDMTKRGTGGRTFDGPFGQSLSRNLTPHESGLKSWSDTDIARAVQQGVSRDGNRLKPPMAYDSYRKVSSADMRSVIGYLRTLKPLPFAGQK
jgi:mono/diheme cytochrome c family protein